MSRFWLSITGLMILCFAFVVFFGIPLGMLLRWLEGR